MTTTSSKIRPPLNGVDTPTLFATLDAVKANPGDSTVMPRSGARSSAADSVRVVG